MTQHKIEIFIQIVRQILCLIESYCGKFWKEKYMIQHKIDFFYTNSLIDFGSGRVVL